MSTSSASAPDAASRNATVRELMSSMTIRATPDDDVLDVVALMVREGVRHLPIVDADDRVVGIVSDRDVRTAVGDPVTALERSDETERDRWPVDEIMTSNPICVPANASVDELARVLVDESIGAVPVIDDDGKLLGIVSYVDLLHFTYRRSP